MGRKAAQLIATVALVFFSVHYFVFAETADDLTAKINTQNKAISDLEAEIAQYQSQLTALGKDKNTLANAIQTLTIESKKLNAEITVTEDKITATNLRLQSLGSSIETTNNTILDLKNAVAKDLREMRVIDNTSFVSVIVGNNGFSDLWHYAAQQVSFEKSIHEKTAQLSTTKTVLISNKTEVESAKKDLVTLDRQLQSQKTINQKTQAQKNSLLATTKNQEANYQKLVKQKTALKAQMESDLHDYESRLKYVLNPSSIPASGSSPFIWPLDKVVITQLFGKTADSGRLYATGSHNGVDFGVPVGTPVKAMARGVVIGSGNTDTACSGASYGNWVFIKYDNGLASVYGHLSLVTTRAGTQVNTGDVVAYSGATGYATGPHLHVSVFPKDGVSVNSFPSQACKGKTITIPTAATNAYLDPMLYWPKQKK